MPENNQNSNPSANAFKFYTVSERKALEAKKEFPKVPLWEKIFNYVYLGASVGCVIACVVLILVFLFAFKTTKFTEDGSFGIPGLITVFLVAICSLASLYMNIHYHIDCVLKDDHRKDAVRKNVLQYVAIIALFAAFGFIWVRPNVTARVTWAYLGWFMMALVWVLCLVGIFLNVKYLGKKDNLVKAYNEAMILGVLWIPVCFYPLLANRAFNITPACILAIFAPLAMDIGYIFYKSGKKTTGLYSLWHAWSFGSYMMDCVAIFYYAVFLSSQVNSL